MCIIKKVLYYEKTKLPVIRYKDEIWVKSNTVANILGYKNTIKSIQGHVDPEDKRKLSVLGPNPNIMFLYVLRVQHGLSSSGNLINMHKIGKIASVGFNSQLLANT